MSRPRAIEVEVLAFAYELRQEYKWSWKAIARELQLDNVKLFSAVNRAINHGVARNG